MSEPKYKIGDRVYYLGEREIASDIIAKVDTDGFAYEMECDDYCYWQGYLFPTKEALLEHIKKQLEELE